jgi:hypothetical protein
MGLVVDIACSCEGQKSNLGGAILGRSARNGTIGSKMMFLLEKHFVCVDNVFGALRRVGVVSSKQDINFTRENTHVVYMSYLTS